jgi:hypothetical protein
MLYVFYTKTTNNMSMTNEMLSARIETLIKEDVMKTARIDALEKQVALLIKGGNVEVEVKKTKKEPKTKKSKEESSSDDEDKPKKKRGTNGYIVYSKSVRDEVIAKLSVGNEKPKNTEIMKQQAAMWAELSVEEKADWTAKAKVSNDVA